MRLLFLCNTPYQIVVASCIRSMFPEDEVHLILSDHSVGHESIYENLNSNHLISDKFFYVETKFLYEEDARCGKKNYIGRIKRDEDIKKLIDLEDEYDVFFCANAEPFSTRLVNYLTRRNPRTIINWFEDGLSAYNYDKVYFPTFIGWIKDYVKRHLLGIYGVTTSVTNYYVFLPSKMDWEPKANIVQISPINQTISKALSTAFNFQNCHDQYDEKYIFFEDGMRDWTDDYDLQLAEKIADIVGKENMIVKIHPRDTNNRFAQRGFKTNQDISIPWEIIVANIDIENKILITMYSQAVITPEILTGKNGKVLALGYLEKNPVEGALDHFTYLDRQFFSWNKESYYVPRTEEEMLEEVTMMKRISAGENKKRSSID